MSHILSRGAYVVCVLFYNKAVSKDLRCAMLPDCTACQLCDKQYSFFNLIMNAAPKEHDFIQNKWD